MDRRSFPIALTANGKYAKVTASRLKNLEIREKELGKIFLIQDCPRVQYES